MKVTPILYSRQLANKLYQIKIRIQTNGKTTFVNSGIEIEKNHWDKKTSRVKELKSIPHYEKQNSEIDRLVKLHKSEDVEFENDPYNFEKFISYFSSQIDILKQASSAAIKSSLFSGFAANEELLFSKYAKIDS